MRAVCRGRGEFGVVRLVEMTKRLNVLIVVAMSNTGRGRETDDTNDELPLDVG
jgi:hypothetical protein